jgi:hypothetical protein
MELDKERDYVFTLELHTLGTPTWGGPQIGTIQLHDSGTGPKNFDTLQDLPLLIEKIVNQDRVLRLPIGKKKGK